MVLPDTTLPKQVSSGTERGDDNLAIAGGSRLDQTLPSASKNCYFPIARYVQHVFHAA